MWSDGLTYEKVEVSAKTVCDSFQLCESDPCVDGALLSKTQQVSKVAGQRLARVPEARFSGNLARRFAFFGCSDCPSEVYASGSGPKPISVSLTYQRKASWYRFVVICIAIMLASVVVSFDPWVRSYWAAWRSILRLTAAEAAAWKADREKLRKTDLIDAANSLHGEVQLWLDNPTPGELTAIAQILIEEAERRLPSHFIRDPGDFQSRRDQYGREPHQVCFVLWWLIRHVSRTIERKK